MCLIDWQHSTVETFLRIETEVWVCLKDYVLWDSVTSTGLPSLPRYHTLTV